MGTVIAQLDEESLVRDIIAGTALPEGVKFQQVEQINDWTGEPALRLYFSVSKRRRPTPKNIKELSAALRNLQMEILNMGLGKFPHTKLVDAK